MRTSGHCLGRFIALQRLAICLPDELHLTLTSGQMPSILAMHLQASLENTA